MTFGAVFRPADKLYAVTIFTSAFLIFQVQPLIGKFILPWFGGTPSVWTTCLLFFQVVLFAGYAYAHASIRWLTPRQQVCMHGCLLLVAVATLPIRPDVAWKPTGADTPALRILGLLAVSVGLPYFLLSATGPLLQAWFGQSRSEVSPYRLYALSNVGSVLGLVTYPFLFEPWVSAEAQAGGWSVGFAVFALACVGCAIDRLLRARVAVQHDSQPDSLDAAPTGTTRLLWFGLSACASVMLLATTNQVCLDVAVIPFLWVLPLTLYLASFILVFDSAWWYPRRVYAAALIGTVMCLTVLMQNVHDVRIATQIVVHFAALFFCCMVCHGELVRLRPSPRHLTEFYLASSAGGAAGGILVGVIAPVVFSQYLELHAALVACCIIAGVLLLSERERLPARFQPWLAAGVCLAFIAGMRSIGAAAATTGPHELAVSRNFYGVLRVLETDADAPDHAMHRMLHGRIVHGVQYSAPEKRTIPTAYYGERSAVGLVLQQADAATPRTVGIVGLGVGTLSAYGRPHDHFRFYEINPDVIRLAQSQFTYLQDSPAKIDVVLGDARLSLEQEARQNFDLLVLDAFSSDAIPAHLLTEEAFAIYLKHLRPAGAIAIHITNRHFDLQPVVHGAAKQFGLRAATIHSETISDRAQARCDWMLLSRSSELFERPEVRAALESTPQTHRAPVLWTDRFNNVVGLLK